MNYPSLPPQFDIEKEIGSGAAGRVIRAKEKLTERVVAIKVLAEDKSSTSEERFHREAKLLAKLNHSHIVRIFQSGISNEGNYYHVMELLDGQSLAQKLRDDPKISREIFFDLFDQMFSALEYAHSFGIVHRDIKPSNIMLSNEVLDETTCNAKLVDFGIGKEFHEDGSEETRGLTKTGALLGTPIYMSPEQCRGSNATTQSDIYSLGCVMYECLAGNPPFRGVNAMETMRSHLHDAVPPLSLPASEQNLENLVLRCLGKDPANRPNAAEALAELEKIQTALEGKLSKRARSLFAYSPYAIAIIATFVLLTGVTWLLNSPRDKEPEQIESTEQKIRSQIAKIEKRNSELKLRLEKLPAAERQVLATDHIRYLGLESEKLQQPSERLPLLNLAVNLCEDQKNKITPALSSAVYMQKGEALAWNANTVDEAREWFNKSVDTARSAGKISEPVANALASRIRFEFRKGNFEKFKEDCDEFLPVVKELQTRRRLAKELAENLATDLASVSNETSSPQKVDKYVVELMPELFKIDKLLVSTYDEASRSAIRASGDALKYLSASSEYKGKFASEQTQMEQSLVR